MKGNKSVLQKLLLSAIGFYQRFISPGLGKNCRFYPSCSSYTAQAIEKYGTAKGLIKGFWRILKCHPCCKGGINLP